MTFLKHLLISCLILLALIWVAIFLGGGEKFDQICIEGRLSEAQAQVINQLEWRKCPKYKQGVCRVEEGDRVIRQECSEFLRGFFLRSSKIRKKVHSYLWWS